MFDLFEARWAEVDLPDIRTFLEHAGEEGVTWEAKGGDAAGKTHPDSLRKAACGLANQVGGYLIVGAERGSDNGWLLSGVAVSAQEPELWIGQILRDLRPIPRFEVKSWGLPDNRYVVVVQIQPVSEPPCMTSQGRVYERVSGETLPVTDPALLDALFRRGIHARARAEATSRAAAERALEAPNWRSERAVGIVAAIAAVGRETDDIGARLFVKSTREAMVASTWKLLGDLRPDDIQQRPQQDAYTVLGQVEPSRHFGLGGGVEHIHRSTWMVQATWDGTVAAGAWLSDGAIENAPAAEEIIRASWAEAGALVASLGGYGPAHLCISIYATQNAEVQVKGGAAFVAGRRPPQGSLYAKLPELTQMDRSIDLGAVDNEVLAGLKRELDRAAGVISDEPERPDSNGP